MILSSTNNCAASASMALLCQKASPLLGSSSNHFWRAAAGQRDQWREGISFQEAKRKRNFPRRPTINNCL